MEAVTFYLTKLHELIAEVPRFQRLPFILYIDCSSKEIGLHNNYIEKADLPKSIEDVNRLFKLIANIVCTTHKEEQIADTDNKDDGKILLPKVEEAERYAYQWNTTKEKASLIITIIHKLGKAIENRIAFEVDAENIEYKIDKLTDIFNI